MSRGDETPRAAWQPPFHPSLVGMQMWELQNNDTVDITASFHMDFAPRVIFGGGAAELWCWGPPIIAVEDSDLYFFSAKDNKAHDGSRKCV